MKRKKNNSKLLVIAIVVAVAFVVMIAIAQGAIARSERTIGRIDAKIEAVMADD